MAAKRTPGTPVRLNHHRFVATVWPGRDPKWAGEDPERVHELRHLGVSHDGDILAVTFGASYNREPTPAFFLTPDAARSLALVLIAEADRLRT